METYCCGFSLKASEDVTKGDIIILCNTLNTHGYYRGLCTFTPECVTDGGIKFNFYNRSWFKTVRLGIVTIENGQWYDATNLDDWINSTEIVFKKGTKINLLLKSFFGAPVFTLDELRVWEYCFSQIGCIKVGKFPRKSDLIN